MHSDEFVYISPEKFQSFASTMQIMGDLLLAFEDHKGWSEE
jgi:hypothetical protein